MSHVWILRQCCFFFFLYNLHIIIIRKVTIIAATGSKELKSHDLSDYIKNTIYTFFKKHIIANKSYIFWYLEYTLHIFLLLLPIYLPHPSTVTIQHSQSLNTFGTSNAFFLSALRVNSATMHNPKLR